MTAKEQDEVLDLIIERSRTISIGGRSFRIQPPSLGKTLILSRYNRRLELPKATNDEELMKALLTIVQNQPDVVCEMLAVFLSNGREELQDDTHIAEVSDYLAHELDTVGRATLLHLYFEDKPASYFIKLLGIDKEQERQRKAEAAKDRSSSLRVGGVSLFGALLDTACERYKWTYQYVVWDISYNVLQTMLADVVQSIYLTESERRRARVSTDGISISGDDPRNASLIRDMLKN